MRLWFLFLCSLFFLLFISEQLAAPPRETLATVWQVSMASHLNKIKTHSTNPFYCEVLVSWVRCGLAARNNLGLFARRAIAQDFAMTWLDSGSAAMFCFVFFLLPFQLALLLLTEKTKSFVKRKQVYFAPEWMVFLSLQPAICSVTKIELKYSGIWICRSNFKSRLVLLFSVCLSRLFNVHNGARAFQSFIRVNIPKPVNFSNWILRCEP